MNINKEKKYDTLFQLGFKFDGENFIKNDMNIHWTEIVCLSDAEFYNIINEFKKRIKASS